MDDRDKGWNPDRYRHPYDPEHDPRYRAPSRARPRSYPQDNYRTGPRVGEAWPERDSRGERDGGREDREWQQDSRSHAERWGTGNWRAGHASEEALRNVEEVRQEMRQKLRRRPSGEGRPDQRRYGNTWQDQPRDTRHWEPPRSDDLHREPLRGLARDPYSHPSTAGRLTDEWGTSRTPRGRRQTSGVERREVQAYGYEPQPEPHKPGLLRELGDRIGDAFHQAFGGQPRPQGPKGYRRSDERIREQICESLAYSHGIDIRNVTVDVRDGVVLLTGTVENRADKFEIEEIADNTFGVTDIDNRLKLDRRPTAIGE